MNDEQQPELDFSQPPLAQSPAAKRSRFEDARLTLCAEEGDAAVKLAEQTCRRCTHWRAEHPKRGPCERLGCYCDGFVSSVEDIDLSTFDPRRLARRTDPPSSHEAARRALASGTVGTHEERILRVLRETRRPLTAKEIGALCGLSNTQVCRRTYPGSERDRTLRWRGLIRLVAGPGEQRFEAVRR